MKRFIKSLALGILLALPWLGASAQQVNLYCWLDAGPPVHWGPCNSTNPLPVSATFMPSGTQNVNLTQILGAAPSLTNPLWVFPATGATFPVSGTVTANQGTAGSAWPVTLTSTTITGNTVVVGPTADGSLASTSPVLIGGTVDGSASGNVGVAKVDAAGLVYAAITNWGGGALGAMANYGTSPGAVLVPGVNAFITNTVTVSGTVAATQSTSPWVVSNSGTFAVQAASAQSGTWTVQPGNTPNTTPWLVTPTPSSASGAALTPTTTAALAANQIIKGSAGNLYSFEVSADSTLSAAAWWIMIYNATTAPGDGAVTPLKCYALPSGATSYAAAFQVPVAFSTGITIGVSTTGCFTKTASTHAFISGDAQ